MSSTALAPEIFKAYDIRGIVGKTLTNDTAYSIGQALGSEALARKQQAIAVGRDGRLSGPDLVKALAQGIASTGCNVVNVGMVPTPVLYFATYQLETHSGVMVTGSHNPPDYNGFKMVLGGETLSGEDIQALRQRIETGDLATGNGTITEADVKEAYLDRITSDITLARPMKVIVDCGNGVAGELAPELYRRLKCDVTEMFCEIDGTFPNHHPDPSQPKNLEDLIKAIKSTDDVDVGLAFDGDGDRVGVVTPDGDVIWPDRQLILLAQSVLKKNPGGEIIFDVKCSRAVDRAIREAGGKPTMWKTGHSFIKKKLKETGALLAGEMSGHIFFKERWYGFDDALYAAARLLELLSQDTRAPQEIFDSLPNTVNTPELQIRFTEGEHFAAIEKLVAEADFPHAKLTTIDGLRADFDDGFGLVRASNTTPVLVLRFEGDDEAALQRIQQQFRELIQRVVPDAELPF
ncbi:MAG: phosphomannomutase/phosphoglucomutase [Acidiferrobacterales bacterium]|jgi:phosphomannomutase/phosphoglucomutase|nr:phosphomannomutase/phosphoglucomutase [Acidiferrobacterales bacterium]